jgi:orotate phosphoribosyltransferase
MSSNYAEMKEVFAEKLFDIGAFKDETQSPNGRGFTLALHEKYPEAPLCPYYLEIAAVQSDLVAKRLAVNLFESLVTASIGLPHLLAPIPQAIVPVVSSLSDKMRIPMITPRKKQGHGSRAPIDGIYEPGQSVVLFDDLISGGDSKFPALQVLSEAELYSRRGGDRGSSARRSRGAPSPRRLALFGLYHLGTPPHMEKHGSPQARALREDPGIPHHCYG